MYSVYLRYGAPDLSLLFKLNSLALFFPGIHNGREEKLPNNYIYVS